ncbi:MAG TPA: UPF0280 family protein [Thermodesulfobacteriaceae bacterium]|nr:UPF0280 family protein [Thermodesulfobacteriaceae bacterium]
MERYRSYRSVTARKGLVSFETSCKETDLHIQADTNLEKDAAAWVIEARISIEEYARNNPGFLESFAPLPVDAFAPPVVRDMMESAEVAGVGPMAAVAGAIACHVGTRCVERTSGEVIVENGGDIFLWLKQPVTIAIWAGSSPLSGRIGIRVAASAGPLGICTSSGTVGHSRSLGTSDAATVVSESVALADAVATATGNIVRRSDDLDHALEKVQDIPGILACVIVKGKKLGIWGNIELVPLKMARKKFV